jgi:acyl-CoA thioester hydrolase
MATCHSDGNETETGMFRRTLYASWADIDFNGHMKNTAYLDKSADLRLMLFVEHGFPTAGFARRRIGPVVRQDEVAYFREVGLHEAIDVTLALAGHAPDGSRFLLRNEVFRADGQLAARVTSAGGWLDLNQRRLIAPPPELFAAMNSLTRTDDYVELPSSLNK